VIGIVGLFTALPQEEATRQLARMVASIQHKAFYSSGTLCDKSVGLYVSWVVEEGGESSETPLQNERGDVVLVFAGEEYSAPEARTYLRERGHEVAAQGPGYLVHLYEEDHAFLAPLNGSFHGVLVDRNSKTATLFNDRFGMHRLHYYESPDAFYFASEAKAILAVCRETRSVDYQSLGEFVSCGAVLENRTFFKGIHALPPASSWTFRDGRLVQESSYFHPKEWEEQEPLDAEAFYQELRSSFVGNLPRYFSGDQRVGMSLTGGLDTRMILANWEPESGSLPCYTFGSMFHEIQDVRVARRVAETCGQHFQVLTAGPAFLSEFASYAERTVYLTDGCADVSHAPDLYLNEKAREVAPVRMTGLYGSEILRGVRAFKPVEPTAGLFAPGFSIHIDQAVSTYKEISLCHPVSFAAFRQGPWHLRSSLALEQTQLTMRTPYLDNDFVRTIFRAPASALASSEVSWRLIADGNPGLFDIPTDRGVGGKRNQLSASVTHAALEFLFKAEYAYDMGMPQWLARLDHAFAPLHLERIFLGRHKPFHFRTWYRDALAGYVQEMLLDSRSLTRPYLGEKAVEQIVQGHLRGDRNHTNEIQMLLTLELIHRLFVDAEGATDASSELPKLRSSTSEKAVVVSQS
jgi:asparagine synthase (glutamine-hydrolysing)